MSISNEQAPNAESKRLRFLERQPNRFSKSDGLGLFVVGTFGLHLLTFFGLVLLYGSYSRLAQKAPPSLVQLDTGKAITVAPLGNKERTPQVVSKFVADTMILMMNWSGTKPPVSVEEVTKIFVLLAWVEAKLRPPHGKQALL
jgi:hypothetical protein